MKKRQWRHSRGLTLLEVMIAMFILTIGVMSFIGVMGGVSKSIRLSKSRTLATNLAQEKIESLKNLSYYRLLVTTAAATANINGTQTIYYDPGYYPPEYLTVGQINFIRGVLVQKVTESSGTLAVNNWYDAETGLKLVTAYVVWTEGGSDKMVRITNLRDNPNRKKIDATFTGTVSVGGTPIQDAQIITLQDPLLRGVSNASGVYSISVPAGNYDLKATKRGYFPLTINSTATSGVSTTVNFPMTAMAVGSVTGQVYINNHLLLSAICAGIGVDDNMEYVQVYNPTESTYTFSNAGTPAYLLEYVRSSDGAVTSLNPVGQTHYVNTLVYPHHYFVVSSSFMVNGVLSDSHYSDASQVNIVPANRIPVGQSGGVRLVSNGVYETAGTVIDSVGWGHSGGSYPYGPAGAREGGGFHLASNDGLDYSETLERVAYSSSTKDTMSISPPGADSLLGNAYDINIDSCDWVHHNDANNCTPHNFLTTENPVSGTPAAGGFAFIDDGLSASAIISSTGAFSVTSIATGTWSMLISSAGYQYSKDSFLNVTANSTQSVGTIFLTSAASVGFASGRVVTSGGTPLSGIAVQTSGGSDTTDSNGYYRFQLAGGTYTIVANPNNLNTSYTIGEATQVVVNTGLSTLVDDIEIYQGGKIKLMVTTNGTDPLPGIPVVATNTAGAEVATAISDSQGAAWFKNMAVGSYTLTPQLETGETATPTNISTSVTAGASICGGTVTVTNAFGTITGAVTKGGTPITTGVFVIAVATGTTISSMPPVNNSTLRNGNVYYYAASADSSGNYSLALRAGSYNVYGWYTTFSVNVASTTKLSSTASVSAGGTATVNFTW